MNHKCYVCDDCGKSGVALWREYSTFLNHQILRCRTCATVSEGEALDEVYPNEGKYGKTDQIGGLVPAVPTREGDTYWGYASVPPEGCDWWSNLPLD